MNIWDQRSWTNVSYRCPTRNLVIWKITIYNGKNINKAEKKTWWTNSNLPPRNSWKYQKIYRLLNNFGVRMSVLPEREINHWSINISNSCLSKHAAIKITVFTSKLTCNGNVFTVCGRNGFSLVLSQRALRMTCNHIKLIPE